MSRHVLKRWLTAVSADVGIHALVLLSETSGARPSIIDDLRTTIRSHYVDPKLTARRLASLGAPKTARLFREHLPLTKKARSGDLGEIIATEIAEQHLQYAVPIRRLRWKDGRNMALRGDDVIGLTRDKKNKLMFLKGESKSRAALTTAALDEAGAALDRDLGRPTRHSVLFVAERLRDLEKDALAQEIEDAVLQSFNGTRLEHMLFVLAGSAPGKLLTEHLKSAARKSHRRYAIGVYIKDHGKFIEKLFSEL